MKISGSLNCHGVGFVQAWTIQGLCETSHIEALQRYRVDACSERVFKEALLRFFSKTLQNAMLFGMPCTGHMV